MNSIVNPIQLEIIKESNSIALFRKYRTILAILS